MSEHTNDTPWEPPFSGTEAEHLLGALDRLRWTFRWKADGLDAARAGHEAGPVHAHPRRAAQAPRRAGGLRDRRQDRRRGDAGRVGGERLGRRRRLGVLARPPTTAPRSCTRCTTPRSSAPGARLAACVADGGLDQQVALAEKLGAGRQPAPDRLRHGRGVRPAHRPGRPASARPSTAGWGRTRHPAGDPGTDHADLRAPRRRGPCWRALGVGWGDLRVRS